MALETIHLNTGLGDRVRGRECEQRLSISSDGSVSLGRYVASAGGRALTSYVQGSIGADEAVRILTMVEAHIAEMRDTESGDRGTWKALMFHTDGSVSTASGRLWSDRMSDGTMVSTGIHDAMPFPGTVSFGWRVSEAASTA